jgi:hypothetical protein
MGFPCYREQRAASTECYSSLRLSAACWRNQQHKAGKAPDLSLKRRLGAERLLKLFYHTGGEVGGFPQGWDRATLREINTLLH